MPLKAGRASHPCFLAATLRALGSAQHAGPALGSPAWDPGPSGGTGGTCGTARPACSGPATPSPVGQSFRTRVSMPSRRAGRPGETKDRGNFEEAPGSKHTVLTQRSGRVPSPTSGAGEKARGHRSWGAALRAEHRRPTAQAGSSRPGGRRSPRPGSALRAAGWKATRGEAGLDEAVRGEQEFQTWV